MLEEAEGELDAQHATHGFVDHALGDFAGADLRGDDVAVEVAFHVHVDAGFEGLAGHRGAVADGVVLELGYGAPVGDDEAVEAPLFAEDLGEDERVGGCRNSVDGVEGAHQGGRARFDRGMVGLR